jgi:hypothetical protein
LLLNINNIAVFTIGNLVFICFARRAEDVGGNLGRSRSLLDVARRPIGSSPSSVGSSSSTGTARTGADPGQQHPYLSRSLADLTGGNEEEGLASLGDKTSVNDVPESQDTTAEIDHSFLDYDDEQTTSRTR